MKYSEQTTVKWHDTDANRNVRPSKIVEYMQECGNRQCEFSFLPLEKLRDEAHLAFILGAISLNIYQPIRAYDEIEVRTWCKEAKSYIFNRYFDILKGGEIVAEASSTWVLVDLESKSMVRASNYPFLSGSFFYDDPIDSGKLLPKARIASNIEMLEAGKRKIVYSDIDYNMHMNNTRYPDMVCDFLDEMTSEKAYTISKMSLSYLKESAIGNTLSVFRSKPLSDGTIAVRTLNESGDVCLEALVELKEL